MQLISFFLPFLIGIHSHQTAICKILCLPVLLTTEQNGTQEPYYWLIPISYNLIFIKYSHTPFVKPLCPLPTRSAEPKSHPLCTGSWTTSNHSALALCEVLLIWGTEMFGAIISVVQHPKRWYDRLFDNVTGRHDFPVHSCPLVRRTLHGALAQYTERSIRWVDRFTQTLDLAYNLGFMWPWARGLSSSTLSPQVL